MNRQITLTLLPIGLVIFFLTLRPYDDRQPRRARFYLPKRQRRQVGISSGLGGAADLFRLNEDGSIKRGLSGSFDPKDFRMVTRF
jgi:hypothetical protein